jgi:hypothetical protein
LDQPEREFPARFLDVSSACIGLLTCKELSPDQSITIETGLHLILAKVRTCQARGAKFEIAAERVHTAAKFDLPSDITNMERNRLLAAGLSCGPAILPQISLPKIAPANYPGTQRDWAKAIAFAEVPLTAPAATSSIVIGPPAHPVPTPPLPKLSAGTQWKTRALMALVAFALCTVMAVEFRAYGKHGAAVVRAASSAAELPVARESVTPMVMVAAKAAGPTPPAAMAAKSVVSIRTSDRSWITACADGKLLFSKLFASGSAETVEFAYGALIRMGNTIPVEIEMNGEPVSPLTGVRAVEFGPGGFHFLAGEGNCSPRQ